MPSFNWLHITDLHRGMTLQGCLWPNVEKQFFADLEKMHAASGPWHVLFFSGDLVQKGAQKEFQKLDETLRRVYKKLNALGSDPILLAVPGNHDLVRPAGADADLATLKQWNMDPTIAAAFWSTPTSGARTLVTRAFQPYTRWERKHGFPRPSATKRGILPGDFAATVEVAGIPPIGVVGLNTAFLQLTDGDYEGKLAVSIDQLSAVCGEHFTDWFDRHACCFLMTHHPPAWLTPPARAALAGEIDVSGRFVAQICGHMHVPYDVNESIGAAPAKRLWRGASLFGLEVYAGGHRRRHGTRPERLGLMWQPRV